VEGVVFDGGPVVYFIMREGRKGVDAVAGLFDADVIQKSRMANMRITILLDKNCSSLNSVND
ncbi:MAG: hypothetical protein KDE47_17205, partial [Caldilineaceae bacterium]|nr:hypothetical protein [Caldilineaceae bacterium]